MVFSINFQWIRKLFLLEQRSAWIFAKLHNDNQKIPPKNLFFDLLHTKVINLHEIFTHRFFPLCFCGIFSRSYFFFEKKESFSVKEAARWKKSISETTTERKREQKFIHNFTKTWKQSTRKKKFVGKRINTENPFHALFIVFWQ